MGTERVNQKKGGRDVGCYLPSLKLPLDEVGQGYICLESARTQNVRYVNNSYTTARLGQTTGQILVHRQAYWYRDPFQIVTGSGLLLVQS